jgi:hypothetical protein
MLSLGQQAPRGRSQSSRLPKWSEMVSQFLPLSVCLMKPPETSPRFKRGPCKSQSGLQWLLFLFLAIWPIRDSSISRLPHCATLAAWFRRHHSLNSPEIARCFLNMMFPVKISSVHNMRFQYLVNVSQTCLGMLLSIRDINLT